MKIEDQVCTEEQARDLQKLGVRLETVYSWSKQVSYFDGKEFVNYLLRLTKEKNCCDLEFIPAPTVAELGVLLGGWLYHIRVDIGLCDNDETTGFCKFCFAFEGEYFQYFKTEAQTRAEALIWLLENEYIKPGDLKL